MLVIISEHYVYDVKGCGLMEIEKLIRFDPYMNLGTKFLQRLYKNDQEDLSLDILWDFSFYYPEKAELFSSILFGDSVPRRCVWIYNHCKYCLSVNL